MTIPIIISPASGRFRILWNNLANAAATVLSASSSDAEYPVANLQNIWPTYKHRTSSLAAPDFYKWDLGSAKDVDYFILWNHNVTAAGTLAIQGNAADAWGGPTLNEAPTWAADRLVHKLSSTMSLRWWRNAITNAANPDGYIGAGHAFLGTFFEPRYSFWKRTPDPIDPSILGYSDGGQLTANKKTSYQVRKYVFSAVNVADMVTLQTIFETLGKYAPFFIIEDSDYPLTTSYYVHAIDWSFDPIVSGFYTFTMVVETMR